MAKLLYPKLNTFIKLFNEIGRARLKKGFIQWNRSTDMAKTGRQSPYPISFELCKSHPISYAFILWYKALMCILTSSEHFCLCSYWQILYHGIFRVRAHSSIFYQHFEIQEHIQCLCDTLNRTFFGNFGLIIYIYSGTKHQCFTEQ